MLILNNSGQDKKRIHIKDVQENTKKNYVAEREGDDPSVKLT